MGYEWGVVALGVVAGKRETKEKTKRENQKKSEINRAYKTHNTLWKPIQHIYETPEILRSMIFSTVSCLQSDNDVSTSNNVLKASEAD